MAAGGSTSILGKKGAESRPEYSQADDQEAGCQLCRGALFFYWLNEFLLQKSDCALKYC